MTSHPAEMHDKHNHREWIIGACLATAIISAGVLLVGCGSQWQPFSSKSWTVRDCEIHESIEKSESDWPDPTYRRTYRLIRDGRELTVGSYQNESSLGLIDEPYAVGDFIVIPTSCYVYRVGPDDEVKMFEPGMADQWSGFAERRGINGQYDYQVDTVQRIDGGWKLSYGLEEDLNGQRPKFIHFVTTDDWQSFQIETNEDED